MSLRGRLRRIVQSIRRVQDVWVGPERAQMMRLTKAGRMEYGAYSIGIPTVKAYAFDPARLTIGRYSSLSETSVVMIGGEHAIDRVTTFPHRIQWGLPGAGEDGIPLRRGDTVIGSDVWLCQRSFVRGGISIGHGAVVGAGAIVTRSVPPFAIVAGNPAKVVRYRFAEEQIAALLEIAWWDWPKAEVLAAVPYLQDTDIDKFIAYARERFPDGAYPRVGLTDFS
jgi:acetyltransferase-like isoleucine patch superfamily enzyme